MWSVNDGLSGNLWKPAGNLHGWFLAGFQILKKNHANKKFGNLPETCR